MITNIFLFIIILLLIFRLIRDTKVIDKHKEYIDELENAILHFKTSVSGAIFRMKEIDHRGSFEADDEVGYVFQELKSTVESLDAFISVQEKKENDERL